MAKVRIRTGSEGPAHDPYGWTEITFTKTNGEEVKLRYGGLGYARLTTPDGTKTEYLGDEGERAAYTLFTALTGMTPDKAERVPYEVEERYLRNMSRQERADYEDVKSWERAMWRYAQ